MNQKTKTLHDREEASRFGTFQCPTYKGAGVDTQEGQRAVQLMKSSVRSTFNEHVLGDLGGFGGLFRLPKNMKSPVLVSGTDGVGTKLKLAFALDKHDTVGIDLVAMCVNDILCQGAKPLFFLDYIATGKVVAEKIAEIVGGISEGCRQAGMALLGGETAEMPDFYKENEYDLAGFAVGVVEEEKLITGKAVSVGDKIVALPSSGLHSNGFSLARTLLSEEEYPEMLVPTKIYVSEIMKLLDSDVDVHALVHMTGGGFYENIPRVLPEGMDAEVFRGSWSIPEIFLKIMAKGVAEKEMFSTFNMGIGMLVFVPERDLEKTRNILGTSYLIGEVVEGNGGLRFDV